MTTTEAGAGSFSAFCTRMAGPREIAGTVQLSGGVLVFRPERVGVDTPVTMPTAEVVRLEFDRGASEVICVHGRRKLRMRMLGPLAARMFALLKEQCLAADVTESEAVAAAPVTTIVSERAQLEVNALITVGAQVTLSARLLRCEIGMDGNLLGKRTFEVGVPEITGMTRADAGRRVVFQAGDRSFVLRGPGAQRAWLAVRALQDATGLTHPPDPVFLDVHVGRLVDTSGMMAVAARSFGLVSLGGALLADGSFWSDLGDWHGTSTGPDGVELHWKGGELLLTGPGAADLPPLLAQRWIARTGAGGAGGPWRTDAVWFDGAAVTCGSLSIAEPGLRFRTAAGAQHTVVPRGAAVAVRIDAHDPRSLRIVVDGAETRFVVNNAVQHARVLDTLFASNAWAAPTVENEPRALSEDSLARISGPAAYVRLLAGERVLAERRDCVLSPDGEHLRLQLEMAQEPLVPQPIIVEVANARGRFVVGGTLTRAVVTAPNQPRRRSLTIQFGSEVRPANRRSFFRLPLRERLPHVELYPAEGEAGEEDDIRLLNVSRRGCGIVLHKAWPLGTTVCFTAPLTDGEIELLGHVVQVAPMDGEPGAFRTGVRYLDTDEYEDRGVRLFLDRELGFLRQRAKSRDEP